MADRTDEEQIEALKRWWAENGRSTIIGVVVALVAVFGYQAWQNHAREQGEAASKLYQDMMDAVAVDSPLKTPDKEHVATARFLGQQLEDEHAGSVYAHFAAMYLAKLAVDDKDLASAEKQLKWSLDHRVNDTLKPIVTLRLARVELGLGKTDDALKALEGIEPGEYRSSYEELKGDIYHAMGDNEQAREAYQRAVNAVGEDKKRPMLQMKLEDLEVAEAAPAADQSATPADAGTGTATTTKPTGDTTAKPGAPANDEKK